jgi:hypothetical protein
MLPSKNDTVLKILLGQATLCAKETMTGLEHLTDEEISFVGGRRQPASFWRVTAIVLLGLIFLVSLLTAASPVCWEFS